MVNRAGSTFAFRIAEETGAPADDIVRAHLVAARIFDEPTLHREIDALDGVVDVDTQSEMHLELRKVVERSSRWLVRYRPRPLPIAATVAELGAGVATCTASMPGLLRGGEREWFESFRDGLIARRSRRPRGAARGSRVARRRARHRRRRDHDRAPRRRDPGHVVRARRPAAARLAARPDPRRPSPRRPLAGARARSARDDLSNERRALVTTVLAFAPGLPADDALDRWIAQHPGITHAMGVLDDLRKVADATTSRTSRSRSASCATSRRATSTAEGTGIARVLRRGFGWETTGVEWSRP